MRFSLQYLAKRLYIKRDRFWEIYTSDEIQSKKTDKSIMNFPILSSDDIDYEYIYSYLKEWIAKKYRDNLEIKIEKIDDNEYLCETSTGALMNNILDLFYKDYKEIFIDNLEKKVVVNEEIEPEIKLSLESLEEGQLENKEEDKIEDSKKTVLN
ncbi:hypothetical protein CN014_005730 (plasmid) [Borrelia miyamotoi]|uniref:BBG30-like protein n=2 Tax=Borrelia miyamotoi TaxID=47466 RepID=A0AAQ3CN80_9SPIR|nr:hypothetical protein [Borrelia miyamotoi]AHH06052.1 Hypothetical protein BOM_1509 [Borrelia miyamotoi FR64b]WAZ71320.1 hypothetical protein O5403_06650 [Borrelia miyamotoi]WCL22209.1 hypothetical protein CNO10_06025 [Borrelia miyamotoi]WDE70412.1 hypothetical protein CNO12_06180 [Borrelia miyamotoi]WDE71751.1 hypothetical protein CNO13_07100 [Borrelia miyamotoi]